MTGVYNDGIKTLPVVSDADIREYLLVSFNSDGEVTPFVKASGAILLGSTDNSSENGVVPVRMCNVSGSRYLKLDNSETIACAGWFTNGATAGTIAPVGDGEPILGYALEGATSGATTYAVIECVLLDGIAAIADAIVNGDLPNFPVGPVVPLT
jgi:hypothetical protein